MVILLFFSPIYVRRLIPIIPFLFLYLYSGLEMSLSLLTKKKLFKNTVLFILWAGVIFDNAHRTFTDPHRTMPPRFGDNTYQECLEWTAHNSKPKEVVVCQIHSYLYLLRGQYCLPYNYYVKTANEFISYLDEHNVKYLVVSPFYHRAHDTYMASALEAVKTYPDNFNRVFGDENARSYVLEYYSEGL